MKKKTIFLCILTILIFTPFVSMATLTKYSDVNGSVVYDSIGEQYWYYGLKDFTNMNWTEQQTAVAALASSAYYGLSDWHVATSLEMTSMWSHAPLELIDGFEKTYVNDYGGGDYGFGFKGRYGQLVGVDEHNYASCGSDTLWPPAAGKSDLGSLVISDGVSRDDLSVFATAITFAQDDGGGNGDKPVPEPATMLLLASGLVGLAGFGRKKFKK